MENIDTILHCLLYTGRQEDPDDTILVLQETMDPAKPTTPRFKLSTVPNAPEPNNSRCV